MSKRPRQVESESEDNVTESNGKIISAPLPDAEQKQKQQQQQQQQQRRRVELSWDRFNAYIQRWMAESNGSRRPLPSSMPPAPPLPTILSFMFPSGALATGAAPMPRGCQSQEGTAVGNALSVCGTGVVYDEVMLEHKSGDPKEFERPKRLQRAVDHLRAIGLLDCCKRIPHRSARTKELRLVHSAEHIDYVDQLELTAMLRDQGEGGFSVGQDLFANGSTTKAARMATGCVIAAALSVVSGEVRNAFALVRPPGHHAGVNTASGFCFFNNVAVAVRVAQEELQRSGIPKPRAMVIDWDVHHCDGTESIFYEDPSVVVVSIHEYGSGRGHVLRKMPSMLADPIDLVDLAALMDAAPADGMKEDEEECMKNERTENIMDKLSNGEEKHHMRIDDKQTEAKDSVAILKSEEIHEQGKHENREELVGTSKRIRKPVDYAKLDAEIDADDNAIAKIFGAASNELDSTSSNSNSDSDSDSSSNNNSSQGRADSMASACGSWRFTGDTDGFSFDECASDEAHEPFYPGTGHLNRVGGDEVHAARGRNINIPWPVKGMGDLEYLQILLDVVAPAAQEFRPDIIFVSCGFDSAAGDLLGSMRLSPSGYYLMTKALAALSTRLVVALEGGYNSSNVACCSEAVMRALLECGGTSPLPRSAMLWCRAEELVRQVQHTHEESWKCFSLKTDEDEADEEEERK